MSDEETRPGSFHAIVELMGHNRIAGLLSEQTIAGNSFLRVDVPAVSGRSGFSKLFNAGAIYAITPVDEIVANAAAEQIRAAPLNVYDVSEVRALIEYHEKAAAERRKLWTEQEEEEGPI